MVWDRGSSIFQAPWTKSKLANRHKYFPIKHRTSLCTKIKKIKHTIWQTSLSARTKCTVNEYEMITDWSNCCLVVKFDPPVLHLLCVWLYPLEGPFRWLLHCPGVNLRPLWQPISLGPPFAETHIIVIVTHPLIYLWLEYIHNDTIYNYFLC